MALWPEMRASYRNEVGRELARSSLDEFIEHVIWYAINSPDNSHQKREAILKTMYGETVEGADFQTQSSTLYDELDAMNAHLNQGV